MSTAFALTLLGLAPSGPARSGDRTLTSAGLDSPVFVAVHESGLNVLHSDFRLRPGTIPELPPDLPAYEEVALPDDGTFVDRLAAARSGPLGRLQPGHLYRVAGTRLLIYAPADQAAVDVFAARTHGTGVASAAVGIEHGTDPDAFLVFVPGRTRDAWRWVTEQRWIDVVSTSYITVFTTDGTCYEAPHIRRIVSQGRLVFSGAGNGEQFGEIGSPSGVPESYQVGGVDAQGRTHVVVHRESPTVVTPNRPYETGDRFWFPAATPDDVSGSAQFGGTSGASPSTAGRAASLISFARELLATGTPSRGPLADGDLTGEELTRVLHHVAVPAEPPSPGRYAIEGFGALTDAAMALARRVLAGEIDEPARPDEEVAHARAETLRAALFPGARCD